MNIYPDIPVTGMNTTYSNATTAERAPTLTDLIALSDQLTAGVQDVADAWIAFNQGKDALANIPLRPEAMPVSTYRIDRLHTEMHERINELQRLASDIRSRA